MWKVRIAGLVALGVTVASLATSYVLPRGSAYGEPVVRSWLLAALHAPDHTAHAATAAVERTTHVKRDSGGFQYDCYFVGKATPSWCNAGNALALASEGTRRMLRANLHGTLQ